MPKPYSYDFRQKVIQAIELDGLKKQEASELFNISRKTINLWLKRKAETGDVQALPNRPRGNNHKITDDINKGRNVAKAQSSCLDCYLLGVWNLQINLDSGRQINHQIRVSRRDQDLFGTYNNNIGGRFDLRSYNNGDRGRPVVTIALRPLEQDAIQTYRAVISGIAQTDTLINGRIVDVDGNQGTATLTKQ
jgi:hypothetical protein